MELSAAGHQVTVVDKNSAAFARLGSHLAGSVVVGIGITSQPFATFQGPALPAVARQRQRASGVGSSVLETEASGLILMRF